MITLLLYLNINININYNNIYMKKALVWPEDAPALFSLAPFFKPLLLTFIPFYQSDKNIERLNAVERK